MIVTIDSFEKYRAFIQDISRDPFFCDPHFTYDPDNLYGSLHRKDESAFAVVADGTVQGLLVRPGLPFRKYAVPLLAEAVRRNGPNRMMALGFTQTRRRKSRPTLRPDLRKSRGRTACTPLTCSDKRAAPDRGRPFSAIYACRSAWISSFRASTPTSTAEVVLSLIHISEPTRH